MSAYRAFRCLWWGSGLVDSEGEQEKILSQVVAKDGKSKTVPEDFKQKKHPIPMSKLSNRAHV